MDDQDERRSAPRHPTRIEVDYASENTFLFAYITDISSMGIFIKTEDLQDVGTRLSLRFVPPVDLRDALDDPASQPLELTGEVMWNTQSGSQTGNPGMGVRFIGLKPQQRSRLLDLVRAIAYLDDREGN